MLRELGRRVVPARAALEAQPGGRERLVVLERVARGDVYGDQDIADWVRDARRLATLEHPNVGRVRDVVIHGDEVLVVSDYVDGVRWSELSAINPRPSVEIALRIFVDVLSGLSAVHNLRDAKREPLKLVHGELTPECIVIGTDGVARIVSTCRVKAAAARPGRDGSAYLAPEVLLADESAGARADVYSVGVMLWEVLTGRPLFPNTQPSAIVTHVLSGRVARPTIPEGTPWAAPLADVVVGALAADPEKRFASAAALAAELRRIAATKLAPPVRVAALVRGTFGDRIRTRREALERGEAGPEREVSGVEPQPLSVPGSEVEEVKPIPSTAPTPLPPPMGGAPVEDPLPPEAIKPPPLPAFRPRQPTLSGVAPPTRVEPKPQPKGTRVVVAPPTPMVAFDVPGAALLPESESAPAASPPPLPVAAPFVAIPPPLPVIAPAPPPTPTPAPVVAAPASAPATRGHVAVLVDEMPRRRRPSRAVLGALLAGPLAFAAAIVVWWAASSSGTGPTPATSASSALPELTATTTGAAPAATTSPTETAAVRTNPPAATNPPVQGSAATAVAPPSVVVPPPPVVPTRPAPQPVFAAPPPSPRPVQAFTPPAAATKPKGKRSYDPEGI